MRQTSKQRLVQTTNATSTGYHRDGNNNCCCGDNESYAFEGYTELGYYNSDRFIPTGNRYERTDGKPIKAYGLEIEMVSEYINRQQVIANVIHNIVVKRFKTTKPLYLMKYQHDGSLRNDYGNDWAVECITQPMTKEFIRNNYSVWRCMFEDLKNGFGIHTNRTCGMHCNLSTALFGKDTEEQYDNILKLYYIIHKYFDMFWSLFLRRGDNTYCAPDRYVQRVSIDEFRVLYKKGGSRELSNESDHYTAINTGHIATGRLELRLVGSCTTFAQFRNTMELVFFLVDKVKKLSWKQLDNFVSIFSGCNQYVYDRLETKNGGYITEQQLKDIKETIKEEQLI